MKLFDRLISSFWLVYFMKDDSGKCPPPIFGKMPPPNESTVILTTTKNSGNDDMRALTKLKVTFGQKHCALMAVFLIFSIFQHIFKMYTEKSTFFSNLNWEFRFCIFQKPKIAHNSLNNGRRAVLTTFLDIDIFWTFGV